MKTEQIKLGIQALFEDSRFKKMGKKQILIYEGDSINQLYHIENGYVKVYNILASGVERIIFIYGPGDIFPLTSYLSGAEIARYFYECMTDVELRTIAPSVLEQKIRNNIDLGEILIAYTNSVNNQFLQRIDVLSVNDARRKIVALLAYLTDKIGEGDGLCQLRISLTGQDIADMSGLTRETATGQLSRLRHEGIVFGSKNLAVDKSKLAKLKNRLAIP